MSKDWFSSWFDSKYYHILYQDRNLDEAKLFIDNLVTYLNCAKESKILDLACGTGRHSKCFADLGLKVTGIDLSTNSINRAKKFESENLRFEVHDMRESMGQDRFDYVCNLFTSFGYFNDIRDNRKVIQSVSHSLKNKGEFILDFINSIKAIEQLHNKESKICSGIKFNLSKSIHNHTIHKQIEFCDNGISHHYEEHVTAFTYPELYTILVSEGFEIVNVFGSYLLEPFEEQSSDRLIIHAKKRAN